MKVDRDSLLALARSGTWPQATAAGQVVPDRDDAKTARAVDILDNMVGPKPGATLLDYGCGEGHLVIEAMRRSIRATGYDPVWQNWSKQTQGTLTTEESDTVIQSHYSDILLYDVLDHITTKDQVSILTRAREWLRPGGVIHIRCHPYVSIHGTHLYATLNLAYAHLVFSDEEIKQLGGTQQRVARIVRPLTTYQAWFKDAGLRIVSEEVVRSPVPPLFHDQDMITLIAGNVYRAGVAGGAKVGTKEVLHNFISIQFVDYKLAVA